MSLSLVVGSCVGVEETKLSYIIILLFIIVVKYVCMYACIDNSPPAQDKGTPYFFWIAVEVDVYINI